MNELIERILYFDIYGEDKEINWNSDIDDPRFILYLNRIQKKTDISIDCRQRKLMELKPGITGIVTV